jgi:hypothetical protein
MNIQKSVVILVLVLGALVLGNCTAKDSNPDRSDQGSDTDTDTDTGTETSTDADADADADVGDAAPEPDAGNTGTNDCPGEIQSFIWIANTAEGTLSKVCTTNLEEVARYYTSPQESGGDPSRTSVNLHGDMVVTNRDPSGGTSSVTKFSGDITSCEDKNKDGKIFTSFGPTDVKPWGEDECMLWNRPINTTGARATAWDGKEDEKEGLGGKVWIGSLMAPMLFVLDGDTGKILHSKGLPFGAYGGAVDGKGGFWIVDFMCTTTSAMGSCRIARVDMEDYTTQAFTVKSGYGISVDAKGRVWTAGMNAVARFDPETGEKKSLTVAGFNRGVAVDGHGSVWVANTNGDLVEIDEEDVTKIKRFKVGVADMVGVAVDHEGYVWTVSTGGNAAYKVDPSTYTFETVTIGAGPYTYSDMTGMQLRGVITPVK